MTAYSRKESLHEISKRYDVALVVPHPGPRRGNARLLSRRACAGRLRRRAACLCRGLIYDGRRV